MIQKLRPGYNPPDRKRMAGDILDGVYDQLQETAQAKLQGKMVTLSMDGWSDINNDPILGFCIIYDGQAYLVDTVQTSGSAQTAEYLSEIATEKVRMVNEKYLCNVIGLVTDNCAAMNKARAETAESAKIIEYGVIFLVTFAGIAI